MSFSPIAKWNERKKFDICQRSTLRGLKKCPSCGQMNGQKSLICRNLECALRKKKLLNVRPFDPIQLEDFSGSLLFSLRSKEKEANSRSFVHIREVTFSLQASNAEVVSTEAICYIESCRVDYTSSSLATCKHIKACKNDPSRNAFPKADVYPIAREVLFNLNISIDQKNNIWDVYKAEENLIPAVQRLNTTTFVVKSKETNVFPAGRLHVTALNHSKPGKKSNHACICKKMKIIVGLDNSVVMEDDVCDHILMLLAAILSHPNGKANYGNFIESLKSYWMPQALNTPVIDITTGDHFFPDSLNLCNANNEHPNSDDGIFPFNENFMTNEILPDLSDVILELTAPEKEISPGSMSPLTNRFQSDNNPTPMDVMHLGDPNLMSSSDLNEDSGMDLQSIIDSIQQSSPEGPPQLELTDCNIELMDQFQLTDQLDICSEDLSLPVDANVVENGAITISHPLVEPSFMTCSAANAILKSNVINSISALPTIAVVEAPPIELPTIEVVKKYPIKTTDIINEVNTRKFPPIPPKRSLIVNDSFSNVQNIEMIAPSTEPSLAYRPWLEYVIERINESVSINEQNNVSLNFHVHEEIFAHFSKSFSMGNKLRIPNSTTTVKHGPRKGLSKYIWYFTSASTVRRIFQTKNISITLERNFELNDEGSFVPYVPNQIGSNQKGRRIYPKLMLYTAFISFDAGDTKHKTGVKVEWIPKVFPKSNFGSLGIEFSLKVRDPQAVTALKTV